jgi:hypothetical protein
MELWQGLTSGTRGLNTMYICQTRGVFKKRTVAGIRYSRGGREASATSVKVASIGTSNIKAKELGCGKVDVRSGVVGAYVAVSGTYPHSHNRQKAIHRNILDSVTRSQGTLGIDRLETLTAASSLTTVKTLHECRWQSMRQCRRRLQG